MTELSRSNPPGRFTPLAASYAQNRPGYPIEAIDFIVSRCRLGQDSILVDVGCGTGISARLFAERSLRVIGIEPNAEMRAAAAAASVPPDCSQPIYRDGRAEATGPADPSVDAVLAAQAVHWVHARAALREFHRILKPDGWMILLWNERDESDPFTAAYGTVIRSAPAAAAIEAPRGRAGEPLLHNPLFQDAERTVFRNEQILDAEGV